jgi:hypothetical protein
LAPGISLSARKKTAMKKKLELYYEDAELLHEAMQRFMRSVGGDISRDKDPSDDNKDKMKRVLALGERIEDIVEGDWS